MGDLSFAVIQYKLDVKLVPVWEIYHPHQLSAIGKATNIFPKKLTGDDQIGVCQWVLSIPLA